MIFLIFDTFFYFSITSNRFISTAISFGMLLCFPSLRRTPPERVAAVASVLFAAFPSPCCPRISGRYLSFFALLLISYVLYYVRHIYQPSCISCQSPVTVPHIQAINLIQINRLLEICQCLVCILDVIFPMS